MEFQEYYLGNKMHSSLITCKIKNNLLHALHTDLCIV